MSLSQSYSFIFTLLLPVTIINASVLRTRSNDLYSVNERLYDPDLYSSLYQETSKQKRLFLVPGISSLDKQFNGNNYDLRASDDLRRKRNGAVTDESSLDQIPEFSNFKAHTGDANLVRNPKTMEESAKLAIKGIQSDKKRNNKRWRKKLALSSGRPDFGATLPRLIGQHRKRYKAGVVDRIAQGFGKRSRGVIGYGDNTDKDNLARADSSADDVNEYIKMAKWIGMMGNDGETLGEDEYSVYVVSLLSLDSST